MPSLLIYLNELSYLCEGLSIEEIRPHVIGCLDVMRRLKQIRKEIFVFGMPSLTKIAFANGRYALGAILNGDIFKDEWLQIKTWEQASSGYVETERFALNALESLAVDGNSALGLLWAYKDSSLVVSIGTLAKWSASEVDALHRLIAPDGTSKESQVKVRNLATVTHLETHRELIVNFGLELSPSSLVYEGDGFVVRMFFDDHEPPHIHVLARRDSESTLAKYAILTLDTLDGKFPPNIERRARAWTVAHNGELMENWNRVRRGEHPIALRN
jgi:hypothetical protein